jgi:hypothetical protein
MRNEAERFYGLKNTKLEVQYPFITLKKNSSNNLNAILHNNNINIVYSGALGEKQNPLKLYNFFSEASKKIENTVFHFFSEGEGFQTLKKSNNNSKIRFHSLVDKNNLEEMYNKSDIQIIPQKENTSKGSLPSKLPNLLSSDCKVMLITDENSELHKFFINNNLSMVVTKWDNEILINSLKSISFIDVIYPTDCNFILVKVDDATKRYHQLIKKGIVIRNRTTQSLCENCLRFTVGTEIENEKLIKVLQEI